MFILARRVQFENVGSSPTGGNIMAELGLRTIALAVIRNLGCLAISVRPYTRSSVLCSFPSPITLMVGGR